MEQTNVATNHPTGENLASEPDDYDIIPGASLFFKLDAQDYSLENYTPSKGLPSNPQDYLKNVMLEAKNCPNVVVAKVKPKPRANNLNLPSQDIKIPGSEFAPSSEWCQIQISNFSVSRAEYSRHVAQLKSTKRQTKKRPKLPIYPLPSSEDEENWRYITLGNIVSDCPKVEDGIVHMNEVNFPVSNEHHLTTTVSVEHNAKDPSEEDCVINLSLMKNGFPPMLRIVLRMEPKHIEANLDFHVLWLRSYGFSHQQGRWIFALLVCLEKPLFPTVISSLRDLSRECARLRSCFKSNDTDHLNGLNLIICIVGIYFEQSDLLDNMK